MKSLIYTPTLTLFDENQNIDLKSNEKLIRYLSSFDVDGFVVFGSSGEFSAFSYEEKVKLVDLYLSISKIPILVGTTSMDFKETIRFSNYSIDKGANGILALMPYYFAASQKNIFDYYDKLAKSVNGDIYIYNYPARTGSDIECKTIISLVENNANIKGIKDTITSVAHTKEIIKATSKYDFKVFSGFDDHFCDNVFAGGAGCISALSNIAPDIWSNMKNAMNKNNIEALKKQVKIINKLMELYSIDSNFSLLFKKILNLNGLDIQETAIFPFNSLDDNKWQKAEEIVKSTKGICDECSTRR